MARMGGSRILKRYAAPPFMQVVSVKEKKFITRPQPGPHRIRFSLPLQTVVRDVLKIARTSRETKYLISRSMFLIDGVTRISHKYPVGMMDVLSVRELNKHYRMVVGRNGRLTLIEIPAEEASMKICRVSKKYLYRGRLTFTTEDGKTFRLDDYSMNIGGSFLIRVPEGTVLDRAPLAEGNLGYVFGGRHAGIIGVVKSITDSSLLRDSSVTLQLEDGSEINTIRDYVMVVGRDKPWFRLL
ncbi:MAG: 30S ribosomal protein S4e [Thermoproteota archaeon]